MKETERSLLSELRPVSEVISNVRWAPLRGIPFERRVQTAAVLTWIFLLGNCLTIFGLSLLNPFLWPLHLAYIIYLWRDQSPENGGRRSEWFRRLPCWGYFAAYFPVKLVKVITKISRFFFNTCSKFMRGNRNATSTHPKTTCLVIIPTV